MFNLVFVVNGHLRIGLGEFDVVDVAVQALKDHVASYSAITRPVFSKSWSGSTIRIDYGARDCYYLIETKRRDNGSM